jgi:hypothetical protein
MPNSLVPLKFDQRGDLAFGVEVQAVHRYNEKACTWGGGQFFTFLISSCKKQHLREIVYRMLYPKKRHFIHEFFSASILTSNQLN